MNTWWMGGTAVMPTEPANTYALPCRSQLTLKTLKKIHSAYF